MLANERKFGITSHMLLTAGAVLLFCTGLRAHVESNEPPIDIRDFVYDSDFVFKGEVVDVNYRNSEPNALLDPTTGLPVFEDGNQVFLDGTDLPFTFVRYRIDLIYKGKAPQDSAGGPLSHVVLRQFGGVDAREPNIIAFVDTYPFFDVGDLDVLFVKDNTVKDCPLHREGNGRLRILVDVNDPMEVPKIYTNDGFEVLFVDGIPPVPDEVAIGPMHPFTDVLEHTIGHHGLEKVIVDSEDEFSLPGVNDVPELGNPLGPQFTEADFDLFLMDIVNEVHTREELAALPPVISADINEPFFTGPLTEDGPDDVGPEDIIEPNRPWLDELTPEERDEVLEEDRIEAELLELTGGDPVLPQTPCEEQILREGPLIGDVSGPEGKRDCRVNFYDVGAVAADWLKCNDPSDPDCFLLGD